MSGADATDPGERAPRPLVVVGAAAVAGMGRWLTEHLFTRGAWTSVTLVDRHDAREGLVAFDPPLPVAPTKVVVDDEGTLEIVGGPELDLAAPGAFVCVAVSRDALAEVCSWLVPRLAPSATISVVSHALERAIGTVVDGGGRPPIALHPLFDTSALSLDGLTVAVAPHDDVDDTEVARLSELIESSGGIAHVTTAAAHDHAMAYVQALTHQTLWAFARTVVESGNDLDDLWALRTPIFESLFGLATRTLSESRQANLADVQLALDGSGHAQELRSSIEAVERAVAAGRVDEVADLIAAVRDRFSGSLFETVEATAKSAVTAARSKRSELAHRRRTGDLVGIQPIGRGDDALRVGRIVDVSPVSVTLEETMLGERGAAALLDGPGRANAKRLGVGGKPRRTTFGLGHVEIVLGDDLDGALDDWLGRVRRDVRFLVPESVSGDGVLSVVAGRPGVREAELVSEVVRTGQRSVVVRVHVRADHDVDEAIESLRQIVQQTYRWPSGLSRPASAAERLHYLGPAGTFSETGAVQAAASVGLVDAEVIARDSFEDVLSAAAEGDLAILPISSSASGLVLRAARALLDAPGELRAGGVVDVAVRFDAYVNGDASLGDLRGATVFSHPQALAQCSGFIARWDLQPTACSSTTEALERVAGADVDAVALAGADLGADLGLKVAEREVDDLSGSITRFLILGGADAFGRLEGGSDPTLRSLWVAESPDRVVEHLTGGSSAFDELLSSSEGPCLWVTSRDPDPDIGPIVDPAAGLRFLGRAPWSPRTPVVRAEIDVAD